MVLDSVHFKYVLNLYKFKGKKAKIFENLKVLLFPKLVHGKDCNGHTCMLDLVSKQNNK